MPSFPAKSAPHRYVRDAGGNIAVMFALSLLVVAGAAGSAIDYVRYSQTQTAYNAAADSAAIAAVAAALKASSEGKTGIKAIAEAAAASVWAANISSLGNGSAKSPVITVTQTGKTWTADVAYDDSIGTSFLSLLGLPSMKLTGKAQSSTSFDKIMEYWSFAVVIDDSSSMGIGATQADMDAMVADPSIGCAFACHWDSGGTYDTAAYARTGGYKLRIDVVDEAVDGMITIMKAAAAGSNIKASLYGLNRNIDELVPTTTTLDDVANHNLQLSLTPASIGNTNYRAALETLTTTIGSAGDGSSDTSPRKAVFLVTDGIHDSDVFETNVVSVLGSDHQDGPIDPVFCQTLKDNGVTVGVLYINYIVPSGFEGYVSAFQPQVLPNLQACASTGLFFNATSPADINQAMQDMLAQAFKAGDVRLTQ